MSVSRHRELAKGLGNRESGPKRRLAFWWASDRSCILLVSSSALRLSHPLLLRFTRSSPLSHNETRIILILPHLVTKPLYLKRRVDYNNLFAPSGAGLTGLSNEKKPVLLPVKRNIFPRRRRRCYRRDAFLRYNLTKKIFIHLCTHLCIYTSIVTFGFFLR